MSDRVLIVGSNLMLLDTRLYVLEANGVAAETRLVEAILPDLLTSTGATLVVACSSLSQSSRLDLVRSAHSSNPRLPCLVVEPSPELSAAAVEADATVQAFAGPEDFVSRIQEMIASERT